MLVHDSFCHDDDSFHVLTCFMTMEQFICYPEVQISALHSFPGNFAEIRCDRSLDHHDGAIDEQRWDPDLLRTDLHDTGVPKESQATFLSNDGTKV